MLGEIVSGAEPGDALNDRILAVLRGGHIARYAPSLRLATSQSFDVSPGSAPLTFFTQHQKTFIAVR